MQEEGAMCSCSLYEKPGELELSGSSAQINSVT